MAQEYTSLTPYRANTNDTLTGNAPDAYGNAIALAAISQTIDFYIFDNAAIVKTSKNGTDWGDEFEIPANTTVSIDVTVHSFNIKNKTALSVARYSVVGWYVS